jgi:hypothetical protein
MKSFTGWAASAGLILAAAAANAQALGPVDTTASRVGNPYIAASDLDGPYARPSIEVPAPRYGPTLLPATEVYTILRESGFSPLGIPRRRGFVYTISVIDRDGEDGHLVIDARSGRIIRFIPAYQVRDNFGEDLGMIHAPAGPLPPVGALVSVPRPPASVPRIASRTPPVPLPKASPHSEDGKPLATTLPVAEPPQQSAAVQMKPTELPVTTQAVAPPSPEAKPAAPRIEPTQEMPKVQGLE